MTIRLFLLQPTVVFAGRINEPSGVTYPVAEFAYDGVTTGSYSVVYLNQTVLIGSTAGASDLGRTRVRKFPDSDTLYIGLSSQGTHPGEVTLTDNAHLSVLDLFEVWAKIPQISDDGETFVDADLDFATYGDSPPVANGGPGFFGTIDSISEVITVTLSAADSFATAPGATIPSLSWDVKDGTITVGTSTDETITATFPAGFRYVTLSVDDSNASTHQTHIPIVARDPADDPCIEAFEIESHRITVEGQELTVRIREAIPASSYLEGTLVMIADGEPSGPTDRSNILFLGWADLEPASIDATETGTLRDVTLRCVDVAGRMKDLPGFPQVIEHAASPSTWQEMATPNMDRFLHFLLQWQSTALDLADWTWSGTGSDYVFKVLGTEGASLWDQVARKAQSMVPDYRLTCNTRGQLRVIVDPQLQDTGDRTSTVQVSLDSGDYQGLSYTGQRRPRVHWLRSNAILASTSAVATAFCIAPGTTPGQGEQANDDGENLAISQSDLNAYAGHKYARLNAPQSRFRLTLAEGSRQGIEPSDLTWVQMTIETAVAAQRGLTFTNARGLVEEIEIRYDYRDTGLIRTVALQWERETSGVAATTVEVEAAAPVDTGSYNVPGTESAFNFGLTANQDVIGVIGRNGYIWTCSDFTQNTPPTWSRNTAAAAAAGFSGSPLRTFVVDPFSPGYRGLGSEIRGYAASGTRVYRVNDLFGTPSYTALHTFTTAASGIQEWTQIACSFGHYEADEADNPWIMVAYSAATGSDPLRTYVVYSRDAGATWSSEIDVSGFTRTAVTQEISRPAIYMSPRTPGLAYVGAWTSSGSAPDGDLYKTTDWGATWSLASEIGGDTGDSIGLAMHIPWESNAAEDIVYFGKFDRTSSIFNYWLWRSVAGSASDISPDDSGKKYGPARGLFSIRALDTDRQELILAGVHDNTDNEYIVKAGSAAVAAVWRSSDAGDTWTRKTSDQATTTTDNCVLQVAFSADDETIWYGWGGGGYLIYTEDDGDTILDKSPSGEVGDSGEFMAIFGSGS